MCNCRRTVDALVIRLQPYYMGEPISQAKGEDYVRNMCKRVCCISKTIGRLGRRKLYDLKDNYDSDQASLHAFNPSRASKITAMAFIREFAKVSYTIHSLCSLYYPVLSPQAMSLDITPETLIKKAWSNADEEEALQKSINISMLKRSMGLFIVSC